MDNAHKPTSRFSLSLLLLLLSSCVLHTKEEMHDFWDVFIRTSNNGFFSSFFFFLCLLHRQLQSVFCFALALLYTTRVITSLSFENVNCHLIILKFLIHHFNIGFGADEDWKIQDFREQERMLNLNNIIKKMFELNEYYQSSIVFG